MACTGFELSAEDMKAIWEDATVREMLVRKGIRMEATPGLCVHCLLLTCVLRVLTCRDGIAAS